jgi:hypothetical protein
LWRKMDKTFGIFENILFSTWNLKVNYLIHKHVLKLQYMMQFEKIICFKNFLKLLEKSPQVCLETGRHIISVKHRAKFPSVP